MGAIPLLLQNHRENASEEHRQLGNCQFKLDRRSINLKLLISIIDTRVIENELKKKNHPRIFEAILPKMI